MILKDLIKKVGKEPKILIDNWSSQNKKGYACFEIENTLLWNKNGIFLNGDLTEYSSLEDIQNIIDLWKLNSHDFAAIGYLSYHFKDILYPKINFTKKSQFPYLFFANPKKIYEYEIQKEFDKEFNLFKEISSNSISKNDYINIIKKIKNELEYGNVYQINFTLEKKFKIKKSSFELYMQIRDFSEPRFGYYMNVNNLQIACFSPEQFFKKVENKIFSYPMKGTAKRSADKKIDAKYKKQLEQSTKDKAEHLMIVDLIRNDLGKISKYGSIKVNNLYNVESFNTVYQMVSEVEGILREKMKEKDIFKALFPGGSITGAPKESAMKIIDSLENYNRNIYTGTIGYIKSNGDMNFNIPIRTMTIKNDIGSYPVGGGIVWDSIALEEWEEAQLKSKILHC
tara:strand:- start:189 stop:1379 length:1191 start_codon:yes stop_codon:yes gene_type:complete